MLSSKTAVVTVLSRHGYMLNKKDFSSEKLDEIRKKFTIKPPDDQFKAPKKTNNISKNNNDSDNDEMDMDEEDINITYKVYQEGKLRMLVPRFYGFREFGMPTKVFVDICTPSSINMTFEGKLRDYQKNVIEKCIPHFCTPDGLIRQFGGGIITVRPGGGKTFMGLFLVYLLNYIKKNNYSAFDLLHSAKFPKLADGSLKTLIIVNKGDLIKQWKQRIKQYIPDARVGIIRRNMVDIENKDIVIGMLHSICMKDYDENIYDAFPFVIFDEAHHLSAKVFSKALMRIQPVYTLGLTATPIRKGDRLEHVYYDYIGPIMYFEEKMPDPEVIVNMIRYTPSKTKESTKLFKPFYIFNTKMPNFSKMKTSLTKLSTRNDLIANIIEGIFPEVPLIRMNLPNLTNFNPETFDYSRLQPLSTNPFKHYRKVLVLSDRCHKVDHLTEIKNRLVAKDPRWEKVIGFYKGGMKEHELDASQEKSVILATYSLASEGLDIPGLDTAILTTPQGDVEQTSGRIMRTERHLRKCRPVIFDIVDGISILENQARNRLRDYTDKEYDIRWYHAKDGNMEAGAQFIYPSTKPGIKPKNETDNGVVDLFIEDDEEINVNIIDNNNDNGFNDAFIDEND